MSETSTTGVYVYQQICKTTAEWAADNSVIPENKWLFERCTDGRIITKLSNGLLPYGKLDEYGLSAWDAAQLGGYEGTKAEFYSALEFIDEKTKIIIGLVASMNGKSAEAPTLEAKPTETTLSYKSGEIICNFTVGQQCRVYDTENKKYVFYKLYDITIANKADWRITSSSGNSNSSSLETVKITLLSNQGIADTSLYGSIVSVVYAGQQNDLTWNGVELSTTIPEQVKYQVVFPDVEGYLSPDVREYTSIAGENRAVIVTYSTEKLTVNVSASDSISTAGKNTTLTNTVTSEVIASKKGACVVFKIPFGINYKVSVDSFAGYISPSDQSFTAGSAVRTVSARYEKIVDSSIVFDKSISDPQNITGDINSGVIAVILSKFRRCLCKKTAEGEVTIAYLKDTDSNYYEDGTAALLDGTEGDVMVDFPEFYYKRETVDANKFRYRFAEHNVDGTFKHVSHSLVGAYKGYVNNGKLYSRSGVIPTVNIPIRSFGSAALLRGVGYQHIDFQQHCVVAFMLYAKYGNRNLQALLGVGKSTSNSVIATGTSNQKGNRDTINETSGYVNGLGIEGVYGGVYEYVKGVDINRYTWRITEPDGVTRNVQAGTTSGYITAIAAESGDFFDMIPTAVGGSETTYYSDMYACSEQGQALLRSYNSTWKNGGVAFLGAGGPSSESGQYMSSRLAFRGIIYKTSNLEVFKILPIL